MITKLNQLIEAARSRSKKRIAVAYAQDVHTIEAVGRAVEMGIVDATLVGDIPLMKKLCAEAGVDPGGFTMVQEEGDMACVESAIKLIHDKEADMLMKGLVSTDKYMRGILNKQWGLLPPRATLSHVTVFELPMYHKLLTVADVAVIPYPDINQKIAITRYLIQTANILGVDIPKIAIMAPSEQMLPGMASCLEAAAISKMGERGQFGNAIIDGPLAIDTAIFKEMADLKKLESPVAGDPDCMLFPTLDSSNVFFKCANQLIKAPLAAMVVGTSSPCILTSRGDTADSKLYSIALAALAAGK